MADLPFIICDLSERARRVREQIRSREVQVGLRRQPSRIAVTIDVTTGEVFGSAEALMRYRARLNKPQP